MASIERGLAVLRAMRTPRNIPPGAWSILVGDALRLCDDGWVIKAIGLGWHVSDLYGAHGLAAWLDCRRVTLLDADGANAGPWCRGFMGPDAGRYRRGQPAHVGPLLWDIRK